MNEIWYNRRFLCKSTNPVNPWLKITPPVAEILMEILRIGYFKQEWFNVAKAIEGLCNEASTPTGLGYKRNWMFWNVRIIGII